MKNRIYLILAGLILLSISGCNDEGDQPIPVIPEIHIFISDLLFSDRDAEPSTFSITSNVPWTITVSDTGSSTSWCKVEPMSGVAGTTTVTVTISRDNDSYDDRSANLKIISGEIVKIITITQKKKDAIILSKYKFEVGPDESTIQVDLKTNINYSVEIPQEYSSWIIKEKISNSKGLQDKSEFFTIKEGVIEGAREGLIIFKSGDLKDTVTVFQTQKNALILNPNEINISNEAALIQVELRSNIEYEIQMPSGVGWVKKDQTRAMRSDNLTFAVDENETYDSRTAKIVIKDKNSSLADTLTINQGQLDAIFIDSNRIELAYANGSFSVMVNANIEFGFDIPEDAQEWITLSQTRGLKESSIEFNVTVNNGFDREVLIPCSGNNSSWDTLYVKQEGIKTILMELYDATGGDNWNNNSNWGSDRPINEWYGVNIYYNGEYQIELYSNNLTGAIPASIGKLINLLSFDVTDNQLTGPIPNEICNLSELNRIYLAWNKLTGSIPKDIGKLSNLERLELSHNYLTGTIPEGLGNIEKLSYLFLNYNDLSGPIPASILTRDDWTTIRDYIINQNTYTIYPPLEYAVLENHQNNDLNMQPINSHDIFFNNKYTILYNNHYGCSWSHVYTPTIVNLFNKYSKKGLGVIAYHYAYLTYADLENVKNYVSQHKMEELVNLLQIDDGGIDASYFFGGRGTPEVMVVDSLGRLCWGLSEDRNLLPEYIDSIMEELEPDPDKPYQSTDFSRDGEVVTLQQASVGQGINLVILGDGFIDKDMSTGGKYEEKTREAMEHFFGKEPTKTFRNRFNVYCVKAVSLNEGIGEEIETVFSTKYGNGTSIEGDNMKCFEYGLKVPNINSTSNVTIINILNDAKYAGTCYMYSNNATVAYCPTVAYDSEQFSQIVQHEATGHGFGKLADEYYYSGSISQGEIDDYREMSDSDGWWANIDFTDDPLTIKWSSFLTNPQYATTVGIYQGGGTYMYGVYRPSEYSIMHYNVGEFNAPSRLAIYKRIMNLSGEAYNYNTFLEYDQVNRLTTRSAYSVPKDFVPLPPPVVVKN